MQLSLSRLGAIASLCLFTASASAAGLLPVSQIFVFGDSLSDTGNAFTQTGGSYPADPPNFDGRLSNGPLWIETFGPGLGVSVTSYAVTGAQSGTGNSVSDTYPELSNTGLANQVANFQASLEAPADAGALYVVFAGSNNFCQSCFIPGVTDPLELVAEGVTDLVTAVATLAGVGAEKFLVFGLPDLGLTPRAASVPLPGIPEQLSQLTDAWNTALFGNLPALPGLKTFDTAQALRDVVADPGAFGFSNVEDACLELVACADGTLDQDGFLFWDSIHPTRATHELLGELALAQVVPIPAAAWLFASALGLLGWMRRRTNY